MKKLNLDKIVLLLVAVAICVLAVLNLCQTERPTVSESENRNLATMPDFTWDTLWDGSYFSDVMAFFADTFYEREAFVNTSKWMDQFKSLSTLFPSDDFTVIIDPNATKPTESEGEDTVPTLPPIETDPPTEPPTEPPVTDPSDPTEPPIPVQLSATETEVTVGSARTLTATVGAGYSGLSWSTDRTDLVEVVDNGDGTASVKALAAGSATVTATVTDANGETYSVACSVTVKNPQQATVGDAAEFFPNGLFIYKGAAYSQSYYTGDSLMASYGALYDRYAQLFEGTRITVMPAPLATITITDPSVQAKISDQAAILSKIEAQMPDSINFINLTDIMLEHADEYLFFKSDHHWTHLGAYYAYYEFATSVGLTPTPLENFEDKILSTTYIGSMASYTGDARVKTFYDTVHAYMPTKSCHMDVFVSGLGAFSRDYCINTDYGNYLAFMMGDHGYAVVTVPENDPNMVCLVMKDSYGNAFIPYLTEHYGKIIVIDPRHVDMNVYEEFKDAGLTDIIFITNTSQTGSAWYNYFYNAIS